MKEEMKKEFAGKRKVLIIGTIFGILIVGIIAILMIKQPNEAGERTKDTEHELPPEIKSEIERLFLEPEARIRTKITRWSVDKAEKRVDIFVRELTPENEQINGKVINGWTINVSYDAELMGEEERIYAEIKQLEEKPEMQIAEWTMLITPGTGDKKVVIIVYNLTPENQQLHGTTIDGWKIYVWKSQVPPEKNETGK